MPALAGGSPQAAPAGRPGRGPGRGSELWTPTNTSQAGELELLALRRLPVLEFPESLFQKTIRSPGFILASGYSRSLRRCWSLCSICIAGTQSGRLGATAGASQGTSWQSLGAGSRNPSGGVGRLRDLGTGGFRWNQTVPLPQTLGCAVLREFDWQGIGGSGKEGWSGLGTGVGEGALLIALGLSGCAHRRRCCFAEIRLRVRNPCAVLCTSWSILCALCAR